MWMVDSNDHATQELKIPMDGRKLRPLMPRPYSSSSSMTPPPSPSCSCIRSPNIHLPWTHPISGLSGVGIRREVPLVSTRWNPTPEQLQALEEMYRRGIRTPSAEQIQQIAAKLQLSNEEQPCLGPHCQ